MKNVNDYEVSIRKVSIGSGEYEYVATFEQFSDIIGVGDTREEALSEANANLKLYFEYCDDNNIAIPEPLVKDELSAYSGKITLRLTKQLHRDLCEYSLKDGMSINSIANDAIRFYLFNQSMDEVISAAVDAVNSYSRDLFMANSGVNLNNASIWKNHNWSKNIN